MNKKIPKNIKIKYDLYSGEEIPFRSAEQYQIQNFLNKENMKKYFQKLENDDEMLKLKNFIINQFKTYCKIKELKYAPSLVETFSINYLPSILTIEKYFDSYNNLIKKLKLNNFLQYPNNINKLILPDNINCSIIQDTREQYPLNFPGYSVIKQKLNYGDYSLNRDNQKIFIERKSINDFWGTLSGGFERFIKEIQRAKDDGNYIIVLVESYFFTTIKSDFIFSKASPEFICHRMRELIKMFPENIQFLFCDGRKEARKLVPYLLYFDKELYNKDCQYLYYKKLLNYGMD